MFLLQYRQDEVYKIHHWDHCFLAALTANNFYSVEEGMSDCIIFVTHPVNAYYANRSFVFLNKIDDFGIIMNCEAHIRQF